MTIFADVKQRSGVSELRAGSIQEAFGSDFHPQLRRALVTGDAIAAALAWIPPFVVGSNWVVHNQEVSAVSLLGFAVGLVMAVAFTLAVLATQRLYLSRVCSLRTVEVSRIGRASLTVGLGSLVGAKFARETHLVRIPVLVVCLLFVSLNLWRGSYATWLSNARKKGSFTRSVILIGANDEAHNLHAHFLRHPELGYRIRGVMGREDDYAKHDYEVPWLGETPTLPEVLAATGVQGAVVAGGALGRPQLNVAIRQLLENNVHVHMSTGINGIDHRRLQSHSLAYEPMVYVEPAHLEGWQSFAKRVLDVSVAGTMLLVTTPLLLAAALAVKLYDRGPVLFRQERVGRHGRSFRILKFRSMVTDAESQLLDLRDQNVRDGPLFKLAFDPRVTPIGRILRATSVDELPQLINVLKGEMSLVGPRPALPSEVEDFDDALRARQDVLPGITGLWQVEARDDPDFTQYQRLDLFYVENWSVALDLAILVGTSKAVFMRAAISLGRWRKRASSKSIEAAVLE